MDSKPTLAKSFAILPVNGSPQHWLEPSCFSPQV
jgi:hypothetical protein